MRRLHRSNGIELRPFCDSWMTAAVSLTPQPRQPTSVSDVDFDNYSYPVVAIGGQCWFAENLRSTVFQDGTLIPEETAATFPNLGTPAQTTYNNATSTLNAQGRHYNGHAAASTEHGGLCPSGWTPAERARLDGTRVVFGGNRLRQAHGTKASESPEPLDGRNQETAMTPTGSTLLAQDTSGRTAARTA